MWRITLAAALAVSALGGTAIAVHDHHHGSYNTDRVAVAASGYAITSPKLALADFGGLARIRVHARAANGGALFVGLARERDASRYLDQVARTEITDLDPRRIERRSGSAPLGAPAAQAFWEATSVGTGARSLSFKPRDGDWRVVVMNPSGGRHVAASVTVGAKTNVVLWVGLVLLAGGLLAAALTTALALRRR